MRWDEIDVHRFYGELGVRKPLITGGQHLALGYCNFHSKTRWLVVSRKNASLGISLLKYGRTQHLFKTARQMVLIVGRSILTRLWHYGPPKNARLCISQPSLSNPCFMGLVSGKILTGNHGFYHWIWGFPVIFRQPIQWFLEHAEL